MTMAIPQPSSGVIEVDIEVYGNKARSSALADFLEVASLAGERVTRARLADIINDNEWVSRPIRQYYLQDAAEDPDTWVDSVFGLLAEREEQLGSLYPFVEKGKSLRLKKPLQTPVDSRYLALLAVTVVHAWRLTSAVGPEATLEDIVANTLTRMGVSAFNIGATDRGTGFVAAVGRAGAALALRPMTDPTPRSRHAKDVGVDTVAGIVWRDGRPAGHWLIIGQVTVGQSQTWEDKLAQPKPPRWARYMQEPLHPQVFLAIPHHVEDEHLRDLLVSQNGIVVDRLRLVKNKPRNTADEQLLIRTLLSAQVVI